MLEQDYGIFNVRSAAILTNAYVAGNIIGNTTDFSQGGVHLKNQLTVYVYFTLGSLDDVLIKFEFSPTENGTYVQETNTVVTGGVAVVTPIVHKFTTSGRIALPIKDRFIKISAEGEGTVTSSSLAITAVIGIQ